MTPLTCRALVVLALVFLTQSPVSSLPSNSNVSWRGGYGAREASEWPPSRLALGWVSGTWSHGLGRLCVALEGSWASLLLTVLLLQLEAQLHRLSSTHQEASSENRQLREAQHDLAGRLDEVREQLQVTRGHLNVTRGRVSWQVEEELRQVAATLGWGGDQGLPGRGEGGSELSEALVSTQNTQRPPYTSQQHCQAEMSVPISQTRKLRNREGKAMCPGAHNWDLHTHTGLVQC